MPVEVEYVKGRTRGGDEWIPNFITGLNQETWHRLRPLLQGLPAGCV